MAGFDTGRNPSSSFPSPILSQVYCDPLAPYPEGRFFALDLAPHESPSTLPLTSSASVIEDFDGGWVAPSYSGTSSYNHAGVGIGQSENCPIEDFEATD
jgi:hypothetical protein